MIEACDADVAGPVPQYVLWTRKELSAVQKEISMYEQDGARTIADAPGTLAGVL